jgi:hypothetical protein
VRRVALARLKGIERHIWARIGEREPVIAIADEDLDRSNDAKTSAVHFLRFELPAPVIRAVHQGESVAFGVGHPAYRHDLVVPETVRAALAADLA